jgi:hypothetical protein
MVHDLKLRWPPGGVVMAGSPEGPGTVVPEPVAPREPGADDSEGTADTSPGLPLVVALAMVMAMVVVGVAVGVTLPLASCEAAGVGLGFADLELDVDADTVRVWLNDAEAAQHRRRQRTGPQNRHGIDNIDVMLTVHSQLRCDNNVARVAARKGRSEHTHPVNPRF